MDRYICIHGHFYQPPRENPWLESIEVQDSAYPFHDWNERITEECYGPNGASRILDGDGRILEIINNYGRISFNFGPTVLAWMEAEAPNAYEAIIESDRLSAERFSGHGSAMAQVYNHIIMPLSNCQDKETQIMWGIQDFVHRFGRQPEGMWLAETAVDLESLDLMVKHGIAFTVLAPHQAARFREIGADEWIDVSGGRIDPTRPYRVAAPSGGEIDIFFYDGPISQGVAFEGLLTRGERFAERLLGAYSDDRDWPQLAHIATDGETYGHHHRHGEMALSYALRYIEDNDLATITNYGEYRELHPATHEAEIVEDSSWSCVHGIERWRANCGCNSGMNPNWNQEWRGPLREALDWLRDELAPRYEALLGQFVDDPWAARNDYLAVILDRSEQNTEQFFERHATGSLTETDRITVLKLLELQRHALLMYTSCGWFFDELSGIETVQVIQYAGRTLQLAEELFGEAFEPAFLELLSQAKSNIPVHKDGAVIYAKFVQPAKVDLAKVSAHYALSTLFDEDLSNEVYCFAVKPEVFERFSSGRARMAVGKLELTSLITGEHDIFSFGALHFGDHNLDGGVRQFSDEGTYDRMHAEVTEAFGRADITETIRLIDRHFGDHSYSLGTLFRDEQRRITEIILENTLEDAESNYRRLYEDHASLMRFLNAVDVPLPGALRTAAEFVMNVDVRRELAKDELDVDYIYDYFKETETWGLQVDVAGFGYVLEQTIERISAKLADHNDSLDVLVRISEIVDLAESLPFDVNFWTIQNDFYTFIRDELPGFQRRASEGDTEAQKWLSEIRHLGDALLVDVA